MSAYDVVVAGGGTNGLCAAALMARAGRRVLLVERNGRLGGMAAGDEFHPGFRGGGLFHESGRLHPGVVDALELQRHGLRLRRRPPDVLALDPDPGARPLWLRGDEDAARETITRGSARDGERLAGYRAFLDRVRPVLADFVGRPPLDLVDLESNSWVELARRALGLRRLGTSSMMELLRVPPMSVADWLDEWFETGLLKAALALPALGGTFTGPRSPGSAFSLLVHECTRGPGVTGGGPAIVEALEGAARAAGVEIRTDAPVTGLRIDDGAVTGVVLEGGREVAAPAVAASCDPRRVLLDWVPPGLLPQKTLARIESFRARGTTAQVLLALDRTPVLPAAGDEPWAAVRIVGDLVRLEQAFDPVKYRALPERPALEVQLATAERPQLAPDGRAVLSALVHYVPRDLEPDWTDEARTALGDRVIDELARHMPALESTIVAREVVSPADIERRHAVSGGHLHHGEHALDQWLIRPIPECSGYRTPLPGLWLCGSGSHPGGGLTCAPGFLAARALLRANP